MDDVFVSYSHKDATRAQEIVDALRRSGFRVFFDPQLAVGVRYDDELESKHDAAKAVLVLWSPNSIESGWVRDEARRALNRNVLVPAFVEKCQLPLGLGGIECADLSFWDSTDSGSAEFHLLIEALVRLGARRIRARDTSRNVQQKPSQQLELYALLGETLDLNKSPWQELKEMCTAFAKTRVDEMSAFRHAANMGETHAQYLLGLMHLFGFEVDHSTDEALNWLHIAAQRGWSGAHHALGVIHEVGAAGKPNQRKAKTYYRIAARKGHQIAMRCLLRMESRTNAKSANS